jgi:hypothetical protein
MNDQTPAFVRTLVPFLVGYLATRFGINPDDPSVALLVSALVGYGWYVVTHLVELRYPRFGWLLGIAKAPAYSSAPAPSPDSGEQATVTVTEEP